MPQINDLKLHCIDENPNAPTTKFADFPDIFRRNPPDYVRKKHACIQKIWMTITERSQKDLNLRSEKNQKVLAWTCNKYELKVPNVKRIIEGA